MAILLAANPAAASPTIIGDVKDPRCREALSMAITAFNSNSFSLDWPIAQPTRTDTKIILKQNQEDISGGDAIDADPNEFTIISEPAEVSRGDKIYWGKRVSEGRRLILVDRPFNWQGDWYAVYTVSSAATPASLRNAELKPALGDNRWHPPLVLLDGRGSTHWIIDRGEPYDILPDWRVHVIAKNGLSMVCRISFGRPGPDGLRPMPAAVRNLAAALDHTLGPGLDEGTLQVTARIRLSVAQRWANAAIRPWAANEAYNTRSEVERGLADWAKGNRRRAAVLQRIRSDYLPAEQALTLYYSARFKDHSDSVKLAKRVLDQMFRSYFVFSKAQ